MRINWTAAARRDLFAISDCIAERNPRAAAAMEGRLGNAVKALLEHPNLGRTGRVEGTRELVISGTPYLIPYRVQGRTVDLLRVLLGAQRWPEDLD